MAITTSPFYDVVLAYRPIKFIAQITVDSTVYLAENAVVEIYKRGVLLTTVRYKVATSTPNTPPDVDYTFNIDIQKYCQDSLAPNTDAAKPLAFADSGASVVNCTDGYAGYYISITYEGVNLSTGFLEDMGILADVSAEFAVFYSSRQHLEQLDLVDYYGTYGSQDGKCLTKSKTTLDISLTENAYLAWATPISAPTLTRFRVRLYDSAGVVLYTAIGTGIIDVPFQEHSNLMAANVGAVSLQANTYTSGTVDFTDPALAYYTVEFGFVPAAVFVPHTNLFTYNIISGCGNSRLRLHWLNLLGGVDSYTFNSVKDYKIKTNSETGKKSLEFSAGEQSPQSVSDYGSYKYNSQASTAFSLQSKFLTNADATWLQDLLVSPKVYVEIDGDLVPVLIEDTEQSIDRHNGRIRYEITVKMANDLIIQRV